MSLFGAMTASVSGLSSQGEAIAVISDNLSNTNTIGYKSTRALFSQLVTNASADGVTYNAGGSGSIIQREQATQGSIISTQSVTDLALSGNGFFQVANTESIGTDTEYFFTRAGAFSENKEGFLVTPDGLYLMGWQTDSDGNVLDVQNPEPIELQSVGVSAQASSAVEIGANLASTTTQNGIYDGTNLAADLATAIANTSLADFITDARVFDAQGGARDVSIAFTKRATNLWDFNVFTDGANIQGGTAGTNSSIGTGTLRFDTDGNLMEVVGGTISPNWSGGVDDGAITIDFGEQKGGRVVTTNTNLGYAQSVLDIAIEDIGAAVANTAPTGQYSLSYATVGTTFTLTAPSGTVTTATLGGFVAGNQELIFSFPNPAYEVRMTVAAGFNPGNGAVGTFDVGTAATIDGGSGSDGVVQFAANFNTNFVNQNGFGSGTLSSISVDESGFIAGTFSNGETKQLYKIAVAVFQNPSGMDPVSGSLLRATDSSGNALLKEAGAGGTASIISGSLEGSTVDIANEFSQMIIAQRAYQANSTVVSTVDQMLNELLQLR